MEIKIKSVKDFDLKNKKVLFRPDINSPLDPQTKVIVNVNRIQKNAPTLQYLLDNGAAVAIIAHQGDTLDYQNLISMKEHAQKLSDA
ncbi:MAG: phosphoglycerate kinase, partial [Eubacteriales bacterium]